MRRPRRMNTSGRVSSVDDPTRRGSRIPLTSHPLNYNRPMGIDNRKRRVAKARSRRSRHHTDQSPHTAHRPGAHWREPLAPAPEELFAAALHAHQIGDADGMARAVDRLTRCPTEQVVPFVTNVLGG